MNLVSSEAEREWEKGEKTMERGKGKGSRIMAYLIGLLSEVSKLNLSQNNQSITL